MSDFFVSRLFEIETVREKTACPVDNTYDKFRTDVRCDEVWPYTTGVSPPEYNVVQPRAKWDALVPELQMGDFGEALQDFYDSNGVACDRELFESREACRKLATVWVVEK